jgi:hypothetical protein
MDILDCSFRALARTSDEVNTVASRRGRVRRRHGHRMRFVE